MLKSFLKEFNGFQGVKENKYSKSLHLAKGNTLPISLLA